MISKKSDDAISPVIGVMLMLVVTVVIAAAVTIFATGVVGETEAAPVAVLDVEIFSNQENMAGLSGPELFITHLSGDAVDTDNIELRTSWNCGVDGCTYGGTHYSVFTAEGFKNSGTSLDKRKQPLYVKSPMKVQKENPEYGSGALNHYFGDVILTPGLRLSASSEFQSMKVEHHTQSPFMDVIFGGSNEFTKASLLTDDNGFPVYHDGIMKEMPAGTAVHVTIIHTPSGQAIYDKVVYVQ